MREISRVYININDEENGSIWINVMERYKNSVLQLICVRGVYNPFRPQQPPTDRKSSGTGFIVDIANGLVLTNAHVTTNAISIVGRIMRFGERDLSLRLVSICREKDIALCQLSPDDIDLILEDKRPEDINMIFGDNLQLKETTNVVTIGFPLAQKNVKFTTGVVSGFDANTDEKDETGKTEEESPSYIQITAPINPGNSGGPLLNMKGEVVGVNAAGYMFSQNIGYAIGSRTVLSIYDTLVAPLRDTSLSIPHIVITPKYALEYNRTTSALLELSCQDKDAEGIYVKRVYPNSVFDILQEGDIITHVLYDDVYSNNPSAFSVINRTPLTGTPVTALLDKFGDITTDIACDNGYSCRKKTFKELFDALPIGAPVSLLICRQPHVYKITTRFVYVPSTIRLMLYPRITPYKYVIVAGMSIGELTLNHINSDKDLEEYAKGKKRYEPRLVVNQIFPDTTASYARVFQEGSIIEEVNDVKVRNIDDLKAALTQSGEYISIIGKERDKLVVRKENALREDAFAVKQFEISDSQSPLL